MPEVDPGGPNPTEDVTPVLTSWLAGLELDNVPERVRERAKAVLLDGIACALVGAQLPWSRTAVASVAGIESEGPGTIIGWDRKLSAPAAALLNSTFIQGFELDDFHPFAPLHSAALVIPSALATAQLLGRVSGDRLLLSAIAGFEVGPRVGMALHGTQMLTRGWHSGSVFGTHAAAATAGVLRRLDGPGFEDALGLAATQSGGLMAAQFEAMSKRMHHGFAARAGLYAAALAGGGYTGIKRVYDQGYGGFLSVFGEGHDPDPGQVVEGLGQRWHTELIAIKSYAAMGGLHAPIDAVRKLTEAAPIDPDTIRSITVSVSEPVFHHGWWKTERPLTPVGAQMNIGYAVAVALLDGTVGPEQFTETRREADDIWQVLDLVDVVIDPGFHRGNTRVSVEFRDGTVRTELVREPKGGPSNPLTVEEVSAKFHSLVHRVVDTDRARRIEGLVLDLERLDDIGELIELLSAPVRGALDESRGSA